MRNVIQWSSTQLCVEDSDGVTDGVIKLSLFRFLSTTRCVSTKPNFLPISLWDLLTVILFSNPITLIHENMKPLEDRSLIGYDLTEAEDIA